MKMNNILLSAILTLLCCSPISQVLAQVTIIVEAVPENTPEGANIFVAGTFNDWNPLDSSYMLTKTAEGTFELTLDIDAYSFEYKFTRGGWDAVEANEDGDLMGNRIIIRNDDPIRRVRIAGWRDLVINTVPHSRFVIRELPENTPQGSEIYMGGSFNDWTAKDPNYKLTKDIDGFYHIYIPASIDSFEYKFNRGSWASVEAKKSGKLRTNRYFQRNSDENITVNIDIENWEDLSKGLPRNYILFMLFSVFFNGFLILSVFGIRYKQGPAKLLLILLISISLIGLLSRVFFTELKEAHEALPKLHLGSDYILFLFAPVFYLLVRSLIQEIKPGQFEGMFWRHFLPFTLQIIIYLPLWFTNIEDFKLHLVNKDYNLLFYSVGAVAFVYNLAYWVAIFRIINKFKKLNPSKWHYNSLFSTLKFIQGLVLLFWAYTIIMYLIGQATGENLEPYVEQGIEGTWSIFALNVYAIAYFLVTRRGIFNEKKEMEKEQKIYSSKIADEELARYKDKLDKAMEEKQLYLNPQLTLTDLAKELGMSTHTLSKAINEGYDKNFNDFVNSYRVEEFNRLSITVKDGSENILSLAYKVGFNSKTAFNRAYKKVTGSTPSEALR
ncbi:helix-turn-helix domain-containing protein [Flammeovirgaceae bacterium SG7u.111]|nr:helix-turn-helix domain-containing protein [Flammeovirgaceae bacterium SG7u.132]WPO34866.1 helix-turn-helix domain-containing protein [Flammeovirgaceae bacterium SG7u.111]